MKRVFGWVLIAGFIAVTTAGIWLPPIITHAVEKDYHFSEVTIDATVLPNGDLRLEETRTFDFQNGPFTYARLRQRGRPAGPRPRLHDRRAPDLDRGAGRARLGRPFDRHGGLPVAVELRGRGRRGPGCSATAWRAPSTCTRTRRNLYRQFIGAGWDKPTEQADITVHLPGRQGGDPDPQQECEEDGAILDLGQTPLERGDRAGVRSRPAERRGHVRRPADDPIRGARRAAAVLRRGIDPVPDRRGADRGLDERAGPATDPRSGGGLGRAGERTACPLARRRAPRCDPARRRAVGARGPSCFSLKLRPRTRVPKVLEEPPGRGPGAGRRAGRREGHLSPQNAYRAQVFGSRGSARLELRADGRVTDPEDVRIVRRQDAMDLPTETDQDFMWLMFGRGERALEEISVKRLEGVEGLVLHVLDLADGRPHEVRRHGPAGSRRATRVSSRCSRP